jgi:uncharacterized protein DUF3551
MRISAVFALALGIAGLGMLWPKQAGAVEYPWCVAGADGYFDCSFSTYPQCQATASGIGGCVQNPRALLFPDQTRPNTPARRRN